MPKVYYCLKCSTAHKGKYPHSWKKYERAWRTDYSKLRRVYIRLYNPDKWIPVGWYCPRCGNFIENKVPFVLNPLFPYEKINNLKGLSE